VNKINEVYRPDAIILQCGADSLAYDKLGRFNLSTKGHGECIKVVKALGKPMILVGGGGYNVANVSRCWAYETGIALGEELDGQIP